jgi:Holliday junction DNA helicase RuvA
VIGRLSGRIVGEESDGALVLDVGGVGYDVRAPLGTSGRAVPAGDGTVTLHTHLHVRDDALELYGFATESERRVFRLLIDVPNVGPKTALGVLSALPPADLASAVEAKDIGRLTRIDGVGKKTAERLVLELKERLQKLGDLGRAPEGAAGPRAGAGTEARLLGALTNMGYRPADAERALRALGPRLRDENLGELLKEALAVLSQ